MSATIPHWIVYLLICQQHRHTTMWELLSLMRSFAKVKFKHWAQAFYMKLTFLFICVTKLLNRSVSKVEPWSIFPSYKQYFIISNASASETFSIVWDKRIFPSDCPPIYEGRYSIRSVYPYCWNSVKSIINYSNWCLSKFFQIKSLPPFTLKVFPSFT